MLGRNSSNFLVEFLENFRCRNFILKLTDLYLQQFLHTVTAFPSLVLFKIFCQPSQRFKILRIVQKVLHKFIWESQQQTYYMTALLPSPLKKKTWTLKKILDFQILSLNFIDMNISILHTVPKLYTPSTLNIDFIQWHTQLIVCAVK